ncbi:aspartate-tRNA ligase [Medicago truncatula]|uniref:aspartate--tRNA ligase n=1 Tax=Medicago truncatula TaxID=3880 RepID=G7KAW8_MEDTR|nr:aspartate-tRNA ligase [Medicago truncatula]
MPWGTSLFIKYINRTLPKPAKLDFSFTVVIPNSQLSLYLCFHNRREYALSSVRSKLPQSFSMSSPESKEPASAPSLTKSSESISKKAAKLEKLRCCQQMASAAPTSASNLSADPLATNYGDIPLKELQSKTPVHPVPRTQVEALDDSLVNNSKLAFLVLKENVETVQCLVQTQPDSVSEQMVKFAKTISRESVVDVHGVVSIPAAPIKGTTQQVFISGKSSKLYFVSRADPVLPFQIEDASRSEAEYDRASQAGEQLVHVNQDTRLNFRVIDLRTPANQGIFRIADNVEHVKHSRQFLRAENFISIHTPKLIDGSSEGGASVFKLNYKGHPACLAQSPQLHKQIAICGDFNRVFEVGAVYRAEDSFTHRHLCEFTGLDAEMRIDCHYFEIMDIVDRLFVAIFDCLNQKCKKDLEAVRNQYPFEPLKYLRNTLRLTYEEGIEMLKEVGVEIEPFGDLNTEAERKLGQLVLEKYEKEFCILHRYPLAVRPFYSMPCSDDQNYSNSFDVFIRGEEIISGAQRIHEPKLLEERTQACGINVDAISYYIEAFRYGAPLHGGFGAGLERVVMLFCGLDNIRMTSLFPRDPKRITP